MVIREWLPLINVLLVMASNSVPVGMSGVPLIKIVIRTSPNVCMVVVFMFQLIIPYHLHIV